MTFQGDLSKVVNIARSQIGVVERPVNKTMYGEWFGWNGVAWCAIFVSWVFDKAGQRIPPIQTSKGCAYVPTFVEHAKRTGQWRPVGTYRPKAGDLIIFKFTNRPDHIGIVQSVLPDGRIQTVEGNCLPIETEVLTPSGWVSIGDLQVGNNVVDPDGKISIVKAVYNKGIQQVYNIDTGFGSVEATADHLWEVENVSENHKISIMTTAEIADRLSRKQRLRLPQINPVDFDNGQIRELDPWLLGYLIGDGTLGQRSAVTFTTNDDQILDLVSESIPYDQSIVENTVRGVGNNNYRIIADGKSNYVLDRIRDMGLNVGSHDKFIPEQYKWAPVKDRIALLQGLLDSDGHIDKLGRIEFCSVSKQLAEDVAFLVRSLGGKCSINYKENIVYTSPTQKTLKSASNAYRVQNIRFADQNIIPFKLDRKAKFCRNDRKLRGWNIRSVIPTRETEVACIEVSSPRSLYITKDFLVTHNTNAAGSRTGGMVAQLNRRSGIIGYIDVKPTAPAIDWNAVRRWTAGVVLSKLAIVRTPLDNKGWSEDIKTLQQALNIVQNAGIAVDGIYGPVTFLNVAGFQNNCKKLGLKMTDPVGIMGDTTKWWLCTNLQNIRDGK